MATLTSALDHFPPMGIYDVLFKFQNTAGIYMGKPGTHPWAQGFPLTKQLPNGPEIPSTVAIDSFDLRYPSATGSPALLSAIVDYYNEFYDANISTRNVCVFAGGKQGIFATISFLSNDYKVIVEQTEYTTYFDLLRLLRRDYTVIPSNESNRFRPGMEEYKKSNTDSSKKSFFIKSNPCNPTGVTWKNDQLKKLVELCCLPDNAAIIDEAYEYFQLPEPKSALEFVDDINDTNLFVISAATKGLQVPGARIGWVIAAEHNIDIFRNYSSICLGGVSQLSQNFVTELLEIERVQKAREAVSEYYTHQRDRYADGFNRLGIELFTGDGGFYHWCKLPNELTAEKFNERLFKHNAAILPGKLCNMLRSDQQELYENYFRFSFGPLEPESYSKNLEIIASCLED